MKYNRKFSLLIFLLVLMSLGAVYATEDIETDYDVVSDISINPVSNTEHVINQDNYNTYFDNNGKMLPVVKDGDILKLSGNFNNKVFVVNKNVTVIGDNVEIKQGSLILDKGASGSVISNLKIINDNGDNLQGIRLDGASYCLIHNNDIDSDGLSSFPIALNPGSDYNVISDNIFKSSGFKQYNAKSTCAMVLGEADHNTIKNNYLEVDDANGIYLSAYGSGSFAGGRSNFNVIFNNTIKCMVTPTSWCYGIQMMGSNNKAESNKVIGTYRGISGEGNSIVINNQLINLKGKNYATGELVGGDYGIAVGANSNISDNTFINCSLEGAGIYAVTDTIISNNLVDVKGTGYGINANGNNIRIVNNDIKTASGACVYQAGRLNGLVVDKNNLTSTTGVGVLAVKSSQSRYPSDITITNNIISTSNTYAINVKDANKTAYVIKNNNIGSSKIITPNGEETPTYDFNFNGTEYNVNPDNYHSFFDSNGNLINLDVKDGDILNFSGVFEEIRPIISYSIKITGKDALFKNSEFKITSDSVWIENLVIKNTNASRLNTWGIYAVDVQNLMIVNNDIFVYDRNAAYAIYLVNVNKANIKNNNLSSSGDYLSYPLLCLGVENSIIENNDILANGTGQIHAYESSKCIDGEKCLDGDKCLDGESCLDGAHVIKEIFRTYGILLITSSNNQVNYNDVVVTSKLNQPLPKINGSLSTNSIVGIDAYYDSNDNIFKENDVLVYGNDNYMYGMGVMGAETNSGSSQYSQNNKFLNNNIIVKGNNMATGIISGYNSKNNNFNNNIINVVGNSSAYGITFEYAKESQIKDNDITLKSDVSYGIEIFDGDGNVISGNSLNTTGSYGFGVAGYSSNNNIISNNQINVKGSADKQINLTNHADALGFGNAGVIFKSDSTGNTIENNEIISSKNQAVDLTTTSNNKVINNYLKGEVNRGNEAVTGAKNNIVENNYGYEFTNVSLANANVAYLGSLTLVADSGINDNKTLVKFYVNGKYVGNATTVNGKATLKVKLNENVGTYDIAAEFSREGCKTLNATAKLNIVKADIVVKVEDIGGKKGTSVLLEAFVSDANGNIVKGMEVLFYRSTNYIGKAITNDKGIAEFVWAIPPSLSSQKDSIKAVASGNTNYNGGEGLGTVTYTNMTQTKITVNNLVIYYNNGTPLEATLSDYKNNPIKNAEIFFKINGKSYKRVTNNDGKAFMKINLGPGNYSIGIEFNKNNEYYGSSTNANVVVLSVIKSEDIELMFRNGTKFTATILDGQGKPLANAAVQLNINGVIYNRTTNADGSCGLTINLAPGKYVITTMYNGARQANNIIVHNVLTENNDLVKYYKNESQYTVKVLDGHGKALANVKVSFNINGVFYERTTNANGIAKMNINLGPGKYIITATYNGCSVSNNINVLSTVDSKNIEMTTANRIPFVVKVLDGQGKPLSDAKLSFNIHGVIYERTSAADGTAKLNINLQAGEYIITTMYNGLSQGNTITVKP